MARLVQNRLSEVVRMQCPRTALDIITGILIVVMPTQATAQDGGGHPQPVPVELRANHEDVRFLVDGVPLCPPPCSTTLSPGVYRFALQIGGRSPVSVEAPVDITGPSVLHAKYGSRRPSRITGWVLLAVGVAVGLAFLVPGARGLRAARPDDPWFDVGRAMGSLFTTVGSVYLAGGILAGAILIPRRDRANIETRPAAW